MSPEVYRAILWVGAFATLLTLVYHCGLPLIYRAHLRREETATRTIERLHAHSEPPPLPLPERPMLRLVPALPEEDRP